MRSAKLDGINLQRARLTSSRLDGASLRGTDLSGANLQNASLVGMRAEGADFRGANLNGADLFGTEMFDVHLTGADLRGANLSHLDIDLDLEHVDLIGVRLDGARFKHGARCAGPPAKGGWGCAAVLR